MDWPQRQHALHGHCRQQQHRNAFGDQLRVDVGLDEIELAFLLQLKHVGYHPKCRVLVHADEGLRARFADRNLRDLPLDAWSSYGRWINSILCRIEWVRGRSIFLVVMLFKIISHLYLRGCGCGLNWWSVTEISHLRSPG